MGAVGCGGGGVESGAIIIFFFANRHLTSCNNNMTLDHLSLKTMIRGDIFFFFFFFCKGISLLLEGLL